MPCQYPRLTSSSKMISVNTRIAVTGLGYIGLPLAFGFGARLSTTGFDTTRQRINELNEGSDKMLEVDGDELRVAPRVSHTADTERTCSTDVYSVTIPTAIDDFKKSNVRPLVAA